MPLSSHYKYRTMSPGFQGPPELPYLAVQPGRPCNSLQALILGFGLHLSPPYRDRCSFLTLDFAAIGEHAYIMLPLASSCSWFTRLTTSLLTRYREATSRILWSSGRIPATPRAEFSTVGLTGLLRYSSLHRFQLFCDPHPINSVLPYAGFVQHDWFIHWR